jgi:beta-lactamase class A
VRARTEGLGLSRTALLDMVRDNRGPDDAPQLSVGSTAELARLFGQLARGEVIDEPTSQRVTAWLSLNCDLSMVASAFGLDPLSHRMPDHSTLLINKTGTDFGVRAEAGALKGKRAAVSYAVSIQFDDNSLEQRLRVLEAMRTVGQEILEYVH